MKPLETLESVPIANTQLKLIRRDRDFTIQLGRDELMSSRRHGSEVALARLAVAELGSEGPMKVLVGGLGMGFTLRAALDAVEGRSGSEVTVIEVFEAVLSWNHRYLGDLAKRPLDDPRARVRVEDVRATIAATPGVWNVILLDVDNGPSAFTLDSNGSLYTTKGLTRLYAALAPGGVLAVWSANPDAAYLQRLKSAGFTARSEAAFDRPGRKGSRQTIFLARKS